MQWVLFSIFIIVLLCFFLGMLFGAPWVPTSKTIVRKMLSMAEIKPGDIVYDLGSGDGRIITIAAREFNAKSIGIDINPFWVIWTKIKIIFYRLRGKASIIWGNIFNQDLSQADVVTLYLLPETNDKLKSKFVKELQPGTRIISHDFIFKGWIPNKIDKDSGIFMYRIRSDS